MILGVHPLIAVGVLASTAATDAAYVFFNAAVTGRRRVWAANWSAIWYLLSAFAVISYTENAIYVLFAASGSWLGAFASVTWLRRGHGGDAPTPPTPPENRGGLLRTFPPSPQTRPGRNNQCVFFVETRGPPPFLRFPAPRI